MKIYFRKMKTKTMRLRSKLCIRSTLLNKLMWGDSNRKLQDLVNSTLNYINQRISLLLCKDNQVPYTNEQNNK